MSLKWFVIHAYSGYEAQVKKFLTERIERFDMKDKFGEILIPTEEVVEMKDGQKHKSERKFFPGYILIQMEDQIPPVYLCHQTFPFLQY